MKKMMIWPAIALFVLTAPVFSAQRNDRNDRISEDRPRAGDRASDRSGVQGDIPRNVLDAVHRRYPEAKVQLLRSPDTGDIKTYLLRIDTDKGQTTARATENGDFVFLGYPDVDVKTLPPEITSVLEGMFSEQSSSVEKFERTWYLVDADFGRQSYQILIDPLGRVGDVRPMREVRQDDPSSLPRATREDEDRLMPRLNQYFPDPRIKSVHRSPDAEGYFWVNLSSSTDNDIWVLMNAQRDVAEYRVAMDRNRLPQQIADRIKDMFRNAQIRNVYRQERVLYEVVQPSGRNDSVVMQFSPTGNVVRVRPESERKAAEDRAAIRENRRDRQSDRTNDRENRDTTR